MILLHCLILAHCEFEFDTPGLQHKSQEQLQDFWHTLQLSVEGFKIECFLVFPGSKEHA